MGLGEGIACDPLGCIGRLADGRLVAYVFAPDAFEEDCRRAAVVVATQ
jgi:competence protein ComEC